MALCLKNLLLCLNNYVIKIICHYGIMSKKPVALP